MINGITFVSLADALMLALGLITAIYLTRRLGPSGYGVYALAIVVISWVEVTLVAPFTRMTIRLVAGAEHWEPIAAAALRAQIVLASIGVGVVWCAAGPIARAFHEPALEAFLRLFAIDMPIFAAATLHHNTLLGRGRYKQRAITSACRWTARLTLIIVLVEFGWSINGALIGGIGASLVELCVARLFVRPGLLKEGFPVRQLVAAGLPLILLDTVIRLFHRLDFVILKVLDGSTSEAGHYAAAQNIALIPALLATAFSTVLLAALTHLLRDGHVDDFRLYSCRAIRFGVILFPFAATTAGCSDELVMLLFGPDYAPTGDVLGPLMFAAVAMFLVSVGSSILFASGHAKTAVAMIAPTLLPAILGYMLVIPEHRGVGAAWVTCLAAGTTALTVMTAVLVVARIAPPFTTLLRAAALSFACFLVADYWSASSAMVVLKLVVMGVAILSCLLLLRECDRQEREALLTLVRRPTT